MSETPEFTGGKGIERAVEKGLDPNADLNEVDTNETKAQAALTLAMHGASNTTIAERLGYSSAYRARMAWERVLATASHSDTDRAKQRELAVRRYNRLLQAVMPQAIDVKNPNQLAYHARALAVIDRIVRVEGSEAPQQIQVSATDAEIQNVVAQFIKSDQRSDGEADIIDGEIVNAQQEGEL